MSKIYEALLQAEQDRLLVTAQPEISSASPSEKIPSTPRASVFSTTLQTPAGPGLDLSTVVPRLWKPSLNQLPALQDRGSAVEQFRSLRSRMQEFRELNILKSILVSSGLPQEGKSFIAINLAISLARHNASRVLLIDGDMRRASLYKLLGCSNTPGLTEYLSGKATVTEVMQRARPSTEEAPIPPGLDLLTFIPGGKEPEQAADLSGNNRFEQLLSSVEPLFDWIIIDSSPVNLVTDGVNLARTCDGVLLVAREGITKYQVAQRAISELKSSKILGFVLNAVAKPPSTGGYYGYDALQSESVESLEGAR